MQDIVKRAWAEIDFSALRHNYHEIRKSLPENCKFMGVVKADAYKHGAVKIAKELEKLGAEYLAVACIDEAVELRENGINAPLMILGTTPPRYAETLVNYNITQTVCSLKMANELSEKLGDKKLKVHYKIDSGMGRLGFSHLTATDEITEALKLKNLIAEGIYSHFAVSDELDSDFTNEQYEIFRSKILEIEGKSGHKFEICHCANSGAVLNYPHTALDMVRPGLLLYGHCPTEGECRLDIKPVMQFRARISAIHEHSVGDTISYGRRFTVTRPMRVAVLSVGYADGLHRSLSGKTEFLIKGKRAKQIGSICMDMCMADVTDIDCDEFDAATIFGTDGDETITTTELANHAGTISYELLCALSLRVPRAYLN